ncbi:unnamed protein product [Hydatigera taeniaeformis]|uniref:EF-hand domain-containing protein n=1 Tax=Hydatigena taeniaeformis TaxID=6205 RepID=A0A0R3X3A8_HYDTA|nr:unnamed protein product [Hydatigera taeniaeformis]
MDGLRITCLLNPSKTNHFRINDLEAILILNGFYPSREDIEQAREKYGDFVSKKQVEDELCRQKNKPPIQMKILFEEIKDMLKVKRGYFSREDLITLFAEEKRPLKEQDVDTLLKDICDNGFLERLTRPVNASE